MGMIFQSYAVWPHMTVRENVAYGLKMRGMPPAERRARTDAMLRGDQAPRARRIATRPSSPAASSSAWRSHARSRPIPDILLLDEPLSNLDANLRGDMRLEIRRLHDEFHNTSIYVTHDQVEAMTMADRIVVMNAGRIEQIGTPQDVYDRPNSRFVARFIGGSNVIDATHVSDNRVQRRRPHAGRGQGRVRRARQDDGHLREDARPRAADGANPPAATIGCPASCAATRTSAAIATT